MAVEKTALDFSQPAALESVRRGLDSAVDTFEKCVGEYSVVTIRRRLKRNATRINGLFAEMSCGIVEKPTKLGKMQAKSLRVGKK